MAQDKPTADQTRIKRTYGIVALCFIVVAALDMISHNSWLRLSSSMLMALGWIMMYFYFPTKSKSKRLLIITVFVVALGLVLTRIITRG